jgi:hypothetical protein
MTESPQILHLREQLSDLDYLIQHISDLTPEKLGEMRQQLQAKINRIERRNIE